MVGSAIWRNLERRGYVNLVGKTSKELDLRNQMEVAAFFEKEKPDFVFLAAAKVGGILANDTFRGEFIYDNLQIQNNVIHHSYVQGVKKLLFLGSSCIYPRDCPQPLKEEYLLCGKLEHTNEPYAVAKIAGIKICESYNRQYGTNFISVMPTNLYGPNDNYDLETSHVLPALLRKFHLGKALEDNDWDAIRKDFNKNPINEINGLAKKEAILNILEKNGLTKTDRRSIVANKESRMQNLKSKISITLWGTGASMREFLHVDDLSSACTFLMESKSETLPFFINIGTGKEISIKDLATIVKNKVGFQGEIQWDSSKPNGTPRKRLDTTKMNKIGWKSAIPFKKGIIDTYQSTFL